MWKFLRFHLPPTQKFESFGFQMYNFKAWYKWVIAMTHIGNSLPIFLYHRMSHIYDSWKNFCTDESYKWLIMTMCERRYLCSIWVVSFGHEIWLIGTQILFWVINMTHFMILKKIESELPMWVIAMTHLYHNLKLYIWNPNNSNFCVGGR